MDTAILNGPTDPSRFLLSPLPEEPIRLIGLRGDPRPAAERVESAAVVGRNRQLGSSRRCRSRGFVFDAT